MIVFIISIIVAIICYVVGKKRDIIKNSSEIIKQILWIEACVFLGGYFITDNYKEIWVIFMGAASIFTLIDIMVLKKKK